MNRKLRQRHRRMTVALAVVAPTVFAAALLTRPPAPGTTSLAGIGTTPTRAATELLADETFTLDGTPMSARLLRASESLQVELAPRDGRAVTGADVLVYWYRGGDVSRVPDGARLLGTLAGPQSRRFALPADAAGGALLFYSLAQQELYEARWPLPL